MFKSTHLSTPHPSAPKGDATSTTPLPFQLLVTSMASMRVLNQKVQDANAVLLSSKEINAQLSIPQNCAHALSELQSAHADAAASLLQANQAANDALQTALADAAAFRKANAAASVADDCLGDDDDMSVPLPDYAFAMAEGAEVPDDTPQGMLCGAPLHVVS